jgi:HEAT repeat protein
MWRRREWRDTLQQLERGEVLPNEIGHAIVVLGKPFNRENILTAKDVVAKYLQHENAWARHEAIWFLISWGRLSEFQPELLHALRHDPDVDNRAYAASCLGTLQASTNNADALRALKTVLEDANEDELIRLCAYQSLLEISSPRSEGLFSPYDNSLSDVNWEWVNSLPG